MRNLNYKCLRTVRAMKTKQTLSPNGTGVILVLTPVSLPFLMAVTHLIENLSGNENTMKDQPIDGQKTSPSMAM